MAEVTTSSTAFTIELTEAERDHLLTFLSQALRAKQIEEHRTDASDFKQFVRQQEQLLSGLIDKLRKA